MNKFASRERAASWAEDWERNKNYKNTNRTHTNQVRDILNSFDFDVFLDIGPGIVGSEAWSVKDMKPQIDIYGFEPQNERFEMLKNANYPGRLFKFAVSDIDGNVEGFMGHEGGKSDFWLNGEQDYLDSGAYKLESVKSVRLDTFLEQNDLLDKKLFIWADIEGAELAMLRGTTNALKNVVGLNLELNFLIESSGHCRWQDVVDLLDKTGFIPTRKINPVGTHADYVFSRKI